MILRKLRFPVLFLFFFDFESFSFCFPLLISTRFVFDLWADAVSFSGYLQLSNKLMLTSFVGYDYIALSRAI